MRRAALLSVALVICAVPASAGAATITPTAGFFADDFTDNANCSLREAIEVANDDVSGSPEDSCGVTGTLGDDMVALEAGGPYVLDIAGPGEDLNATGDLDITSGSGDLAIDGGGAATTTIDTDDMPAWSDRVLHHLGGPDPLTVSDLTLTGGGGAENGAGTLLLRHTRGRRGPRDREHHPCAGRWDSGRRLLSIPVDRGQRHLRQHERR